MRAKLITAALSLFASVNLSATPIVFSGVLGNARVNRTISDSTTGTQALTNLSLGLLAYTVAGDTIYAYCMEPQQGTGLPGTIVDYVTDATLLSAPLNIGGITVTIADAVRLLLGQLANPFDPNLPLIDRAAMQVAIWELVRERNQVSPNYNVATGNIFFSNDVGFAGVVERAQQFLDGVNANTGTPYAGLVALVDPTFQDLIGLNPTPEPATFALIGAGLVGLAVVRRRRRV